MFISKKDELLKEVKNAQPEFLFLFGPFLDKSNELIEAEVLEVAGEYLSYEEFFEKLLINISQELQVCINFIIRLI